MFLGMLLYSYDLHGLVTWPFYGKGKVGKCNKKVDEEGSLTILFLI